MKEADRKQRNLTKLQELHPAVRSRVEAVLREMESYGYRPRIQEAWRSLKDQLAAYNAGKTKVKYGFHNVTSPTGKKEALAADIWDDDRVFNTKTDFMLHLLAAAEKNELTTGIRWSLSEQRIDLIEDAIAKQDWKRPVWVGWDPLHVEVTGITVQEAEAGERPELPEDEFPEETPEEEEEPRFSLDPVRFRVENLESGQKRDYDLTSPLRPVSMLPVPYLSQLGRDMESDHSDCGTMVVSMLLAAYNGAIVSPNILYDKYRNTSAPFLNINQVRAAMVGEGIAADVKDNLTIKDLFGFLLSGTPCIIPVNYKIFTDARLTERSFSGPHFSVLVGMDSKNVYLHDPIFTDPENGSAHTYPIEDFLKAWTDTNRIPGYPIPQRSGVIPSAPLGIQITKRVRITADRLNVRQGPGTNHNVIDVLNAREEVTLLREAGGWGEIAPGRWVNLAYTEIIPPPDTSPNDDEESESPESETPRHQIHGTVINVNLASSVPQNPMGGLAAQYNFKDPLIPSSHRDLCGDIALSMIYETITRKSNSLGFIYTGSKNTTRKPTSGSIAYELAQQFANTFPADWKAHCYYLSYIYYFDAGKQRHLPESPGALKESLTQKTPAELKTMISKMITDRTFVIAGVMQNTRLEGLGASRLSPKGVGHWVVVAGISDEYIYINNPFMNRRETYSWNEFLASFSYWLLQILPPENFKPQSYSGPMEKVHPNLEQDRNKI